MLLQTIVTVTVAVATRTMTAVTSRLQGVLQV
jgi:hypothetical protein